MTHARRDSTGLVTSLHRDAQAGTEYLPDDHPDVAAFLGGAEHASGFGRLDADLIRVIEDLVDVLVERRVIRITDLPEGAQEKLFARKSFRTRRGNDALDLYRGPDDGVIATDFGLP